MPYKFAKASAASITDQLNHEVVEAPTSGAYLGILGLVLSNSHASVGTWVNVKSGTDVTKASVYVGAGQTVALPMGTVGPLELDNGDALYVQCETSGSSVRASAWGRVD